MHSYGTATPRPAADHGIRKPFRVAEVARILDVHQSTIYRDIEAGRLRALRVGTGKGALRILPDALDAYLALLEVRTIDPTATTTVVAA